MHGGSQKVESWRGCEGEGGGGGGGGVGGKRGWKGQGGGGGGVGGGGGRRRLAQHIGGRSHCGAGIQWVRTSVLTKRTRSLQKSQASVLTKKVCSN